MKDCPRVKLIELVRAEGSALFETPQRIHDILQAMCPDCAAEVMSISAAVRQGLPGSLVAAAANPGTQWMEFTAGWAQRLQSQDQLPPDFAAWAVDSWALALGISIGPAAVTPAQPLPPANPAQVPPVAMAPPTIPVPYPQSPVPAPTTAKSAKAGPIALVLVLVAVAAGCVYFIKRSRFDGALSGNWQSTSSDGAVIWTRTWQVSPFGGYKVTETLDDSGQMDASSPNHVLVLYSLTNGKISVPFSFQGQEKVQFTGPPLAPEGKRVWDWSTKGRGIPNPNRLTFVGTWITSTPQHRLTGSMSLTIGYDASYKLTAKYSGGGTLHAKGGNYSILSGSGAEIDSGTYQVNGEDQVVFTSKDKNKLATTWTRAHP